MIESKEFDDTPAGLFQAAMCEEDHPWGVYVKPCAGFAEPCMCLYQPGCSTPGVVVLASPAVMRLVAEGLNKTAERWEKGTAPGMLPYKEAKGLAKEKGSE